jgi:hypothetical protein
MTGFRRTRPPPLVVSSGLFTRAIYRLSLRDHVAFILQGFRDLGRCKHVEAVTVVKSCSSVEVYQILGGNYRLHLQGLRQERNQFFVTGSSCCLLITGFLLGLLIHHEDGGGNLLRTYIQICSVTTHQIVLYKVTTVSASNPIYRYFHWCHCYFRVYNNILHLIRNQVIQHANLINKLMIPPHMLPKWCPPNLKVINVFFFTF